MLHGILQSAIVPVSTMKNSTKCSQSPEDEETNLGGFLSNEDDEIYLDKDHEIHLDENILPTPCVAHKFKSPGSSIYSENQTKRPPAVLPKPEHLKRQSSSNQP